MGRDRFGDRSAPLAWVATQEWDGAPKLRPEAQDRASRRHVGRARADHAATSEASAEPAAGPRARPATAGAVRSSNTFRQSHDLLYPGQRPVVATAPKPKSLMNHREGPAVPWAVSVRTGGYPHPAWAQDARDARVPRASDSLAQHLELKRSTKESTQRTRASHADPVAGVSSLSQHQRHPALLFVSAAGDLAEAPPQPKTKALPEHPRVGAAAWPTRARMRGHGIGATAHAERQDTGVPYLQAETSRVIEYDHRSSGSEMTHWYGKKVEHEARGRYLTSKDARAIALRKPIAAAPTSSQLAAR